MMTNMVLVTGRVADVGHNEKDEAIVRIVTDVPKRTHITFKYTKALAKYSGVHQLTEGSVIGIKGELVNSEGRLEVQVEKITVIMLQEGYSA